MNIIICQKETFLQTQVLIGNYTTPALRIIGQIINNGLAARRNGIPVRVIKARLDPRIKINESKLAFTDVTRSLLICLTREQHFHFFSPRMFSGTTNTPCEVSLHRCICAHSERECIWLRAERLRVSIGTKPRNISEEKFY